MHELESVAQERRLTRERLLAAPPWRQQARLTFDTNTPEPGDRWAESQEACYVQEHRDRPLVVLVLLAVLVAGATVMLGSTPLVDVPRVLVIAGLTATSVTVAIVGVLALVQQWVPLTPCGLASVRCSPSCTR